MFGILAMKLLALLPILLFPSAVGAKQKMIARINILNAIAVGICKREIKGYRSLCAT